MEKFSIFLFIIIIALLIILMIKSSLRDFNWIFDSNRLIKSLIREKIDKNIINIFVLKDNDPRVKPIYKKRSRFDYFPGFNTSAKKEYYVKVDYMEKGAIKHLYIRIDYNFFKKTKLTVNYPQ